MTKKVFVQILIIVFIVAVFVLVRQTISLNNNKIYNVKVVPTSTSVSKLDPITTIDPKTGWKIYKNDVFQIEYPRFLPDIKYGGSSGVYTGVLGSNESYIYGRDNNSGEVYYTYFHLVGPVPNPNHLELSKWLSTYDLNSVLPRSEKLISSRETRKVIDGNPVIIYTEENSPQLDHVVWFSTPERVFSVYYGIINKNSVSNIVILKVSEDFDQIISTLKFQ